MSDLAEPYIPRDLDREFALAVRAALVAGDTGGGTLRELVRSVVSSLREQGASSEQVLDAMEDAVAAVLAARVSGGYQVVDPMTPSPAAQLADRVRLLTSEVLLDAGIRTGQHRVVALPAS